MPFPAVQRTLKLTLVALYVMATVLVAAAFPVRGMSEDLSTRFVLPNGEAVAFCHSGPGSPSPDGRSPPSGSDHRACCATCLMAGGLGLDAALGLMVPEPPSGRAVEAGFVVVERITVELTRPVSRGPPLA